jgi:hypothetical protein
MTVQFADIARQAAAEGAVSADDILALRRASWDDGSIGVDEADAIFTLNDELAERSREWTDFFVEAIGEFVVNGTRPKGYVGEDNAAWLMARIDRDGQVEGLTELELLVRVLERALNAPDSLKAYVLAQVERAVLTGAGPTRDGGAIEPGRINETEAQILRRVLFAPAGDGPAAVSRGEAELLFRLKDAALGAPNAPEWKRLFAQGVGDYLMGVSSETAQLSAERAATLDAFMADHTSSIGGFLGRMVKAAPQVFGTMFERRKAPRHHLADLASAEDITAEERAWLDAEVDADGKVDEYEQALLDFLAEETA